MVWEAPPFCGVGCGGVDGEALLCLWCGVSGIPLPPSPAVVWGVVGGNPASSSLPVVWGLVGGKGFPPSLWCGVWWVGIPLPPPCGVGFGGVEFVLGSIGGLVVVVKLL